MHTHISDARLPEVCNHTASTDVHRTHVNL